jgi:hypothetical protein
MIPEHTYIYNWTSLYVRIVISSLIMISDNICMRELRNNFIVSMISYMRILKCMCYVDHVERNLMI